MMVRYLLTAVLAALALLPSAAFAKNAPITCMGAIDKAEKQQIDWSGAGAKGFWIIDGASIKSMKALHQALVAAKQNIPVMIGGDFSGWDFRKETFALGGVCYKETNFAGANFTGLELFGIGFIKVNLEGATFDNSKLEYALLREANLKSTKMRAASLMNGRLDGGWDGSVEQWDLTGANMTGFQFDCGITIDDGCSLDRAGTKFTGTILTNADLSTLPFWGQADYYGAVLNGTIVSPRQLNDLEGADIRGNVTLKGGDTTVKLTPSETKTLITQARAAEKAKDTPSFDCAKASTKVEKMICGNLAIDLRQLDRQMAAIYGYVRPKNPAAGTEQKTWLAKRAACKDDSCVADAYVARINTLVKQLGAVELLQPGKSALYISDDVPFLPSFVDTPLHAKIAAALVGSSTGSAVLHRGKNGAYALWGSSIGANAHTCTLSGDGLKFNAKTGWFSIDGSPIFRMVGDEMEIIGNGNPDMEKFPDSGNYVTCGMRAMFSPMKAINVDAKLLQAQTDALAQIAG